MLSPRRSRALSRNTPVEERGGMTYVKRQNDTLAPGRGVKDHSKVKKAGHAHVEETFGFPKFSSLSAWRRIGVHIYMRIAEL